MTTRRRVQSPLGTDHVPRLPSVCVPRARLWARLEEATEGAVTVLVGPGGAGKTLGVSGWLRRTGRAETTAWVRADSTWAPARMLGLLTLLRGELLRLDEDESAALVAAHVRTGSAEIARAVAVVSSLYSKLSVNRRSAALAAARTMNLL